MSKFEKPSSIFKPIDFNNLLLSNPSINFQNNLSMMKREVPVNVPFVAEKPVKKETFMEKFKSNMKMLESPSMFDGETNPKYSLECNKAILGAQDTSNRITRDDSMSPMYMLKQRQDNKKVEFVCKVDFEKYGR